MTHMERPRECRAESINEARQRPAAKQRRTRWAFHAVGLLSLVWFLFRVLPKPARAAYPCQKVAAPLAGGFVLWVAGALASMTACRRGVRLIVQSRLRLAVICLGGAALLCCGVILMLSERPSQADNPVPNEPIGVARGIQPGRVVWEHNPDATHWSGPGDGHWWESSHTSQDAVDRMISGMIRGLSGRQDDREAWDALFRHFNKTHGKGDVGYKAGEKIVIKVNLVGCIIGDRGNVDPKGYDMVSGLDYMNTSPQVMIGLIRQLVRAAGVRQADISIGDPLTLFPNQYYLMCHPEFPEVHYLDHNGGNSDHPRTRVKPSSVPIYWSCRPAGKSQDFVPDVYAESEYFINVANLKSHTLAGVTLCAKNHLGSLIRTPVERGYYNLHDTLAKNVPGYGHYRSLVDLMGHAHTGGKGLVYLIDGLYSGVHPIEDSPKRWKLPPFNGRWSSSLLASQDPVAIDSVAFDFLYAEWNDHPRMSGADDYLHEAALADNPPSGTFYDPDHAGSTVRLASLGVHEHWNNAQERKYSRNLGRGAGIELVSIAAAEGNRQSSQ